MWPRGDASKPDVNQVALLGCLGKGVSSPWLRPASLCPPRAGPRFWRTGAADGSATGRDRTSVPAGTTRHQDHKGMTGNLRSVGVHPNPRSLAIGSSSKYDTSRRNQIVVQGGNPAIGHRWAATDRRNNQHEHGRSVTDPGSVRTLQPGLTCGSAMILHGLLRVRRTGRCWSLGSDTEEVTGSNPVAPTIPALSRGFVDQHVPPIDGIGGEDGSTNDALVRGLVGAFAG
jgi:hypothetical protein